MYKRGVFQKYCYLTTAKDMTEQLIVDFPPQRRPRSVRFAEETSVPITTERPTDDEINHRWYSEKEQGCMNFRFRQQVDAMRRKINATPASRLDPEDFYECVGMEKYLSPKVFERVVLCRQVHVRAILAASVNGDDEQLSMLSERTSKWSVTRSRDFAVKYWVDLEN